MVGKSQRDVLRKAGRPSVVLLVETNSGHPVAVRFPTAEEAREWEDANGISSAGCVPYVSGDEALRLAVRS